MKHRLLELALLIWVFLAPIQPAMGCVMALPIVDLILALYCAKRAGQPLTSTGLKRTVAKILMYEAATILAFLTETYLTGPALPCLRLVTGLIGCTELKSCLEHLDEAQGSSLFAMILSKLSPPNEDK